MLRLMVWQKLTDVSEVFAASIIRVMIMAAVRAFESLVSFFQTIRHNISEDSNLHTRRCENLKFHHQIMFFP
jgi:hypothetical protein